MYPVLTLLTSGPVSLDGPSLLFYFSRRTWCGTSVTTRNLPSPLPFFLCQYPPLSRRSHCGYNPTPPLFSPSSHPQSPVARHTGHYQWTTVSPVSSRQIHPLHVVVSVPQYSFYSPGQSVSVPPVTVLRRPKPIPNPRPRFENLDVSSTVTLSKPPTPF